MNDATPSIAETVENLLHEADGLGLTSDVMPVAVRDALGDYRRAIRDGMSAADQLEADLAELKAKADLVPPHGLERLRGEAVADAEQRNGEAYQRATKAMDTLKAEVREAALPKVPREREQLARDELLVAFADAKGAAARTRAVDLAQTGNAEVVGALLSSYGTTLLQARGLGGRDLQETLDSVKTLAASVASERATTPRELIAAKAFGRLDRLAAAKGAMGSHLHSVKRFV